MKKTNRKLNMERSLSILLVAILLATACGKEPTTPLQGSTVKEEPTKADPTPTKEVEEAPTPTPEPVVEEVTPEPIVEDNPNVIRGYDFTEFNNGDKDMWKMFDGEVSNERLMWVVLSNQSGSNMVYDVLLDGESIEMNSSYKYSFSLYSPKSIETAEWSEEGIRLMNLGPYDVDEGLHRDMYSIIFTEENNKQFDDYPLTLNATYDDGKKETITVSITRH